MNAEVALAWAAAHSVNQQASDGTLSALVVDESPRGWLVMVTPDREPVPASTPNRCFVVAKQRSGVWRLPPRISTLAAFDQHHLYVRNAAET